MDLHGQNFALKGQNLLFELIHGLPAAKLNIKLLKIEFIYI